jgi:outer membrane protein assembly factor BamB
MPALCFASLSVRCCLFTAAALLIASSGFAPAVFAADWTEFRGPGGQGVAESAQLPVSWTNEKNVLWRTTLEGKGWSSPVLLKGRLYLTSAVGATEELMAAQTLRALALDATSGKVLWQTDLFQQPEGQKIHKKNSHASPTPVTDGEHLYVHFGTHGTACLTLDGAVVWKTQEIKYVPVHGNGGSPILVDDLLVFSCDGSDTQGVVAVDRKTGKVRWRTPRSVEPKKGFAFGTPLLIEVDGRRQIVSSGPDAVMAYDPATGNELWKVRYAGGYSVVPRPVFGAGLLFICTGYDAPRLLAIKPNGAGDVTETHIAWELKKSAPLNPSPLLVGQELYLISDNGIASCLDAATGTVHWQERIGGNFSASPQYAAGRVYLQSEEGVGVVLKAGTKFEELARNETGERTLASYALDVDAGDIFLRTDTALLRIGE